MVAELSARSNTWVIDNVRSFSVPRKHYNAGKTLGSALLASVVRH